MTLPVASLVINLSAVVLARENLHLIGKSVFAGNENLRLGAIVHHSRVNFFEGSRLEDSR